MTGFPYFCASIFLIMKSINIEGQLRTDHGKKAARLLRSQKLVPGVIYGGTEEINFSAPASAFKPIVYTPEFMLADIKVGGQSYKCILKDLQFDKVYDELIHCDFLQLVDGKHVIATLPVRYTGNAAGVKEGGRLVTKMKTLKVKALPKHLRESIEVDVTALELAGSIRVQDIKLDNMEVLNSPRIPMATIVMTRQLKQEAAAEAKDEKKKK